MHGRGAVGGVGVDLSVRRIQKGPGALCIFPQIRKGPLPALPCGWMNDDPRHVIGFGRFGSLFLASRRCQGGRKGRKGFSVMAEGAVSAE